MADMVYICHNCGCPNHDIIVYHHVIADIRAFGFISNWTSVPTHDHGTCNKVLHKEQIIISWQS